MEEADEGAEEGEKWEEGEDGEKRPINYQVKFHLIVIHSRLRKTVVTHVVMRG